MDRPNVTIAPSTDMPYMIERKGSFESAHRLEGHPKCGKLHGHSYNYLVIIQGDMLEDKTGFLIDYSTISSYFNQFDHSDNIIDIACEVFCERVASDFALLLPKSMKASVSVFIQETGKSWAGFTYNKESMPEDKPDEDNDSSDRATNPKRPSGQLIGATATLGDEE